MVLTIKNFESQSVGPGVTETAPTNLVGVAGTLKATLTWTSATGESGVIWSEEKLVRKEGSAPSNSLDGTTVATITTKDTYATNGYEDTGLDSTKTYYYKVFAVYDNGTERGSSASDVTPTAPTFTGLCFTAQEAGSQVQLNKNGNPTAVNLEISTDGDTWTDYTIGNPITLANVGSMVFMRNKSETDTGFSTGTDNYYQFSITGKIGAGGDIGSLLNKNSTNIMSNHCFYRLFAFAEGLVTTPNLPASVLSEGCYNQMFNRCTSLTELPVLPATTLATDCYRYMFSGCSGVTTAPALPATTLATNCYYGMFSGCSGVTTAPALPVTTLATGCYKLMFSRCANITTAPVLPATTLVEDCYAAMFSGSGLTTAPALPATTLATNCYNEMFLRSSISSLPTLPATTLATGCYKLMFYECTNIKLSTTQIGEYQIPYRIPSTGTGTAGVNSLTNMFYGIGGTFTGTPSINTTYYTSNTVV